MANTSASGTSQLGLQLLCTLPQTFKRVFVERNPFVADSTHKTGTILFTSYHLASNKMYVFDTVPFYRGGIVRTGLPQNNVSSSYQYRIYAQWREAGLPWELYADDA